MWMIVWLVVFVSVTISVLFFFCALCSTKVDMGKEKGYEMTKKALKAKTAGKYEKRGGLNKDVEYYNMLVQNKSELEKDQKTLVSLFDKAQESGDFDITQSEYSCSCSRKLVSDINNAELNLKEAYYEEKRTFKLLKRTFIGVVLVLVFIITSFVLMCFGVDGRNESNGYNESNGCNESNDSNFSDGAIGGVLYKSLYGEFCVSGIQDDVTDVNILSKINGVAVTSIGDYVINKERKNNA